MFLRRVALLLAGVALLYLVAMNVFLRTRLFRDAIGFDPDMLVVDYSSAYSLWPGSIHAEGLSIRGRDSNVEWLLRLDRCDFQVSLTDLAHQKFHAGHVRGDGLSFRVRLRQDAVSDETLSALPPVPGFDYPPLRDVGPEDPPLTDATYHLWSIELDDVVATHVREVWIHTVRTSGDLEIRGRWTFRPIRWLDVGPATIEVHSLDVSFGTVEPWASGVTGHLEVTVHPFSLVKVAGSHIVDQVSLLADASGTVWGAAVTNRALEGEGVDVTRATAPFQVHADIDHGRVRAGTHLRTEPFDARVAAGGAVFEASLQADAQVDREGVGYADLRVVDARASAPGQHHAHVARLAATLVSRHLDLASEFFSAPLYEVEVDAAETASLAYWRRRIPVLPDVRVLSGAVTFGGRLEGAVRERTCRGHVTFGVRKLTVTRGDERLDADATGTVHIDGSLEEGRVVLSGTELSLRDVRAADPGASVQARSLDLHARSLVVAPSGVVGQVTLGARALAGVRGLAHVQADVDGVVSIDGSLEQRRVALSGTELAVREVRASLPGTSVQAESLDLQARRLVVARSGIDAQVSFRSKGLAVARGDAHVLGDVAGVVHLDGSAARRSLELSGSELLLHDVHATVKGVVVDAPSIALRIDRLGVDPTGFTGRVAVDAPFVEVPSLVTAGALLPLPADVVVEGGRGTAGVALVVDVSKRVATGQIALAARDLRLRVGAQRMEGDLTVSLSAQASGAVTDLSGSVVDYRHVGAAEHTLGWWGRVRLRQATLALGPRARFHTYLNAAARDGSPLTALVSDNTAIPQWLLDVVSTKGLEATGELLVTPSVFAVRSVQADAEGAKVGFELGRVGGVGEARREWALLLDLGAVLAGVDVDNGHTQVVLFGAAPWFKAKVGMLESVERGGE